MPPLVDDLGVLSDQPPSSFPPPSGLIDDLGILAEPAEQGPGLVQRLAQLEPSGLAEQAVNYVANNPREVAATGVQMGAPIAGYTIGAAVPLPGAAPVLGGLGGLAGYVGGQAIRGQPLQWQDALLNTVTGAVPGFVPPAVTAGMGPATSSLLRAGEGAVYGGGTEAAREALHGEPLSWEQIKQQGLIGGGIGGLVGGVVSAFEGPHGKVVDDLGALPPEGGPLSGPPLPSSAEAELIPTESFAGGPREGSKVTFPKQPAQLVDDLGVLQIEPRSAAAETAPPVEQPVQPGSVRATVEQPGGNRIHISGAPEEVAHTARRLQAPEPVQSAEVAQNVTAKSAPALRLDNGQIVSDPQATMHSEIMAANGINPGEVRDTGWLVNGQYVRQGQTPNETVQGIVQPELRGAIEQPIPSARPPEASRNVLSTILNQQGAVEQPQTGRGLGAFFQSYKQSKARSEAERAAAEQQQASGLEEMKLRIARQRVPPTNAQILRGAGPGTEEPPPLYGPGGELLERKGALSAANPEKLSPASETGVPVADEFMQRLASERSVQFEHARRGVVPVAESFQRGQEVARAERDLKDSWGLTDEEFAASRRKHGEAANSAGLVALNEHRLRAAAEVAVTAKIAQRQRTEVNTANARDAISTLIAHQLQFEGAKSEAGRSLNILRHMKDQATTLDQAVRYAIKQVPVEKLHSIIQQLSAFDPHNGTAINRFVNEAIKPSTTWDKAWEWLVNWGYLSAPTTGMANVMGNTVMALERPVVGRALSATADLAMSAIKGTPRQRFYGEVVADSLGMIHGTLDGLTNGVRAFITEMPVEAENRLLVESGIKRGAIKNPILGRVARLPGTSMLAVDEFFRAVSARGELYSQAYRTATQEGLRGEQRLARMGDIIGRPEQIPGLREAIEAESRYRTFTDPYNLETKHGRFGRALEQMRNVAEPARVFLPFLRTPINIGYAGAFERTPLSMLDIFYRGARGRLQENQGKLADEIAVSAIGTSLAAGLTYLAYNGLITGSAPRDPNQRVAWLKEHPEYALKIANHWVPYGKLEPYATSLGIVADGYQIVKAHGSTWEELASKAGQAITLAIGQNFVNKTYLSGVANLMDAMLHPEQYGDKFIHSLVGLTIPNLLAAIQKAKDPELKQVHTLQDVFAQRTGIGREKLRPMRDMWGEPISTMGYFDGSQPLAGFLERLLVPGTIRTAEVDPETKEVLRVEAAPSPIDQTITVNGKDYLLSYDQLDDLTAAARRRAKTLVSQLIRSPGYQHWANPVRRDYIKTAFSDALDAERLKLEQRLNSKGIMLEQVPSRPENPPSFEPPPGAAQGAGYRP